MVTTPVRTVCWSRLWNKHLEKPGFERLVLTNGAADSAIFAVDEDGSPFWLNYHLRWARSGCLLEAHLVLEKGLEKRCLHLHADGLGHWKYADGQVIHEFDGCIDIDIWPTPFTNSFPLWRTPINIGERKEFRMAWIDGCRLTFKSKSQGYSRLGENRYLFESLDESQFRAELTVDSDGLVIDYPGLFRQVDL